MEAFQIPVGPHTYAVERMPGELRNKRGETTASEVNHAEQRIKISGRVPANAVAAVAAVAIAQAWQDSLTAYAQDLHARWNAFEQAADAAADPDQEWSEDDGPQFVAAFDELARLGVRFDPAFAASMAELKSGRSPSESFVEDYEDERDNDEEHAQENGETDSGDAPEAREWRIKAHAARVAREQGEPRVRTPKTYQPRGGAAANRQPVWCVELRRKFDSRSEAGKFVGRAANSITTAIGRRQKCRGYRWEDFDPEIHKPEPELAADCRGGRLS